MTKTVKVDLDFDEAMRRLMKVKPPEGHDYRAALEKRKRERKKS